jgi:hypothetical protein
VSAPSVEAENVMIPGASIATTCVHTPVASAVVVIGALPVTSTKMGPPGADRPVNVMFPVSRTIPCPVGGSTASGTGVGVGVGVIVGTFVGVVVEVAVEVDVAVAVGIGVWVAVGVAVGVWVGVDVSVGVGVGVGVGGTTTTKDAVPARTGSPDQSRPRQPIYCRPAEPKVSSIDHFPSASATFVANTSPPTNTSTGAPGIAVPSTCTDSPTPTWVGTATQVGKTGVGVGVGAEVGVDVDVAVDVAVEVPVEVGRAVAVSVGTGV